MNGKTKDKAVALRYDRAKSEAPLVVASGSGVIAQKIIETAKEAGIYIKHDPDLLEMLAKVPVGETIPEQLFQTVAELLAFVYKANNNYKDKLNTNIS
ncbi:MAG: EscU/YscU/HrcU family type III secretion system export apparatus switch protein [Desulfobulbaceae bacterium]|nr:EscU/YscU/HrcU family type III secretion system export apparatus switch protein [Desulfobulbaceae bacterium]